MIKEIKKRFSSLQEAFLRISQSDCI